MHVLLQVVAVELHLRVVGSPISQDRKMSTEYLLHCLLPSGLIYSVNGASG
jgi:hypothetical protein